MIKVQAEPFDAAGELTALKTGDLGVGASVLFIGTVRELAGGRAISAMTLEHYPGMTENALAEIEAEARKRWPVNGVSIIHRYGRLEPGDDIVMVAVTSAHRDAAFEAAAFLMDWLKTKAPFWKLESGGGRDEWVEAREADDDAARRWTP